MASQDKPKLGFIGLGLMGQGMVKHLQSCGWDLTVMAHRNRKPIDEAVARGATEAKTPAELAKASDFIMLCMDTSDAVESNVFGDNGILAGIRPGSMLIDFGTSLPGSTKRIAAALEEKGASMLDSPLARTPVHAATGELNIMAGGTEADFERAKPILDDLGENVFHVGPQGAGHTLKLINNAYAMTTACAMAEAFAMADLAGLKRETLYNVMSAGPLKSGMMDFIKSYAIDKDDGNLAFTIVNARKDVGYYTSMADDFKVPSFLAPAAKHLLGVALSQGRGNERVPRIVDFIADIFSGKGKLKRD